MSPLTERWLDYLRVESRRKTKAGDSANLSGNCIARLFRPSTNGSLGSGALRFKAWGLQLFLGPTDGSEVHW